MKSSFPIPILIQLALGFIVLGAIGIYYWKPIPAYYELKEVSGVIDSFRTAEETSGRRNRRTVEYHHIVLGETGAEYRLPKTNDAEAVLGTLRKGMTVTMMVEAAEPHRVWSLTTGGKELLNYESLRRELQPSDLYVFFFGKLPYYLTLAGIGSIIVYLFPWKSLSPCGGKIGRKGQPLS